jgi:thiol:disulfide interchange protein
MGFPMLATAVWLVYISTYHFGQKSVLWIGLFLVLLATAAWVYGQFVQRGAKLRGLAGGIVLTLLLLDYFWVLETRLHWRNPQLPQTASGAIANEADGIQWEKWSPESVASARAAGRPVFIDFTAVWCLTCQLNKESSIEIDSVKKKLKELNALPLLADFTTRSPQIAAELKKFNRAGVPLVVIYPANQSEPPLLLPEILTPSIVLNALDRVSRKAEAKQFSSRN